MKSLTLLGSTGSIGTSTLDVVRRRRDSFSVYSLVAGKNVDLLVEQIREFAPRVVVVATPELQDQLHEKLIAAGVSVPQLDAGSEARIAVAIAPEVDIVMSAIVGVAGLEATYEAVRHRKLIGLANKEVLVASGKLVMDACRTAGTEMIPVDSEHNGAHQCLRAGRRDEVTKLILTASGGPFRQTPREDLKKVTVAQALNHPTWKMGQRITIDSATMMNKVIHVKYVPGTYIPLQNKRNDYLMDRAAQKAGISFSGIEGIAMQDASLQESMGPIQDRTRENLVGTDNGIIMMRNRLMKAAKALAEKGEAPPGTAPAHQQVRSAAVLLPHDMPFKEAAREALRAEPGKPHASV